MKYIGENTVENRKNQIIKRDSNIELLRIVAIIMVITLHYLNPNMGGALASINKGQNNYYFIYTVESFCIVAVNLFVLITGYFMGSTKSIKLNKVAKILFLAYFYGVILYLVSVIIGANNFGYGEIFRAINIKLSDGYWYIKTYIILCLLAPFINVTLDSIDKKNHRLLIMILILFFSVWPSFFSEAPRNDQGYGIINFVLLYIIGNYIKKYIVLNKKYFVYLGGYIACSMITTFCSIFNLGEYWNYNFIFNIIGAIFLFLTFLKIRIYSKLVNYISSFVLVVYIMDVNKYIVRLLYNNILDCKTYYYSKYFIVHMIGSVIVIFLVFILIEILRRIIFKVILKCLKLLKYKKIST